MKTRTGFVSNSSSCSFVLVGIKLNAEEMNVPYSELMELFDDFDILTDEDYGPLNKNELIVGQDITTSDETEIGESDNSIFDLIDIGKEVSKKIGREKNIDNNISLCDQIRLYTGVRMC